MGITTEWDGFTDDEANAAYALYQELAETMEPAEAIIEAGKRVRAARTPVALPVIEGFTVVPVNEFVWTDDYSFHREMTCRNHPNNRFISKNPWMRNIFCVNGDCSCPLTDLLVLVKN